MPDEKKIRVLRPASGAWAFTRASRGYSDQLPSICRWRPSAMRSARAIHSRIPRAPAVLRHAGLATSGSGDPLAAGLGRVPGLGKLPAHGQAALQGDVPRGLLGLGRERPVLQVLPRGGHRDRRQQGLLVARERLHQAEPRADREHRGLGARVHALLDEVARGLLGEAAVLEAHPVEDERDEVERRALALGRRSSADRRRDGRDGCGDCAGGSRLDRALRLDEPERRAPRSAGRSRRPAAPRP